MQDYPHLQNLTIEELLHNTYVECHHSTAHSTNAAGQDAGIGATPRATYKIAHICPALLHGVLTRMRGAGKQEEPGPDGRGLYRILHTDFGDSPFQVLR